MYTCNTCMHTHSTHTPHTHTHYTHIHHTTHTHTYTNHASSPGRQVVNHAIGEVLSAAKDQNRQLDQSVFEMGYSRRPTVGQWLEQKKMQKQRELQEDMIQWDRWGRGGGEGGRRGDSGGGVCKIL